MKRYLLSVMLCVCVVMGAWAYGGGNGSAWTLSDGTWTAATSLEGDLVFSSTPVAPKAQYFKSERAGLFAQWATDHSNELTYFGSSDYNYAKLSGTFNAADLQALFSQTFFQGYPCVDLSDVTITGDVDWSTLAGLLGGTQAVVLPTSPTPDAETLGIFQNYQNDSSQKFPVVAYFAESEKRNLHVFCPDEKISLLAPVVASVDNPVSLMYMQAYNADGTQPTDGNLYPSVAHAAIDGLKQLRVAEVDFTWANVSELKNKAENGGDDKYHFDLNAATHYLVIPQNTSNYLVADDFTDETNSNYVYGDNIWVVSTYKGTASPYAVGATFGGQWLRTDNDAKSGGINETTNITYIRKNGALAGATPYLTDYAKTAQRMIVVSKPGAGSISEAEGYVSDLESMSNVHSISVDLSQYVLPASERITNYQNDYVRYLTLPTDSDPAAIETLLGRTQCPASIGVYDSADHHLYTYSRQTNAVTKLTKMMELGDEATDVKKVTMKGLLTGADFACSSATYNIADNGDISGSGNDASALWKAVVEEADFSEACFVPQSQMTFSAFGYAASLKSIKLPETSIDVCGSTYKQTEIPASCLERCTELEGTLVIPDNIVNIGDYAFAGCNQIESATFGENVRTIGSHLFEQCTNMTSVSLNKGLTNISDFCFSETNLQEIAIPEGVTTIGESALAYIGIRTLRLPTTLKTIGPRAFQQCRSLVTITIPENVEKIGSEAFVRCDHITDVYFLGTTTIPEVPVDVFGADLYRNNNGFGTKGKVGTRYKAGDYSEALNTYDADKAYADYSSWATFEDGVKTAGAAFLHYPVVNTEAGYAVTDYAASYATYLSALESYEEAVAEKADEVAAYEAAYAAYLTDLEAYNNAKEKVIYRRPYNDNPTYYEQTTAEYVVAHSDEDFFVVESVGGYTAIPAWQTNTGSSYPIGTVAYYTLDNGNYVDITANVTDYTSAENYASGTGLYVYDSSVINYAPLDDATKNILLGGEPTAPTPVDGMPTKPTAPTVYVKSGDDYVVYSGEPQSGTTYYVATVAGQDIYGEYYTVPARNASYGGVYYGDDYSFDANHAMGDVWPNGDDQYCWQNGQTADRTGFSTPDGKNRDGLKNFLLVSGFTVDPEDPESDVKVVEHVKKDVWYTICMPFDLTDLQLEGCFGAGYEVARFASVTEKADKSGFLLNFTTKVTPDEKGVVIKKHIPYMIHPNSMYVNEDGTPKETVFTVTGVVETAEDHNYNQEKMMENAVTVKAFDDSEFTFVGYGHNYQAGSVLIPRYSFFLGTKAGDLYPKYWRQTGADNRASGGYWNKNIAVVLPPVYSYENVDSRSVYSDSKDDDGEYILLSELRNETGYYNYVCSEYVYKSSATAKVVKSFDINFTDDVIDDFGWQSVATGIVSAETTESDVRDTSGRIYGLNGQYMGRSLEGLPKGVYIVNGKKLVVN